MSYEDENEFADVDNKALQEANAVDPFPSTSNNNQQEGEEGSKQQEQEEEGGKEEKPPGAGYERSQPALVQMDITSDPLEQDRGEQLANQQQQQQQNQEPQVNLPPRVIVIVNLVLLALFLGWTLSQVKVREQYLALTCFAVPLVLFAKLWIENGTTLPYAQIVNRFVVGFIFLLPLIAILSILIMDLALALFGVFLNQASESTRFDISLLLFIFSLVVSEESCKLFIYLFYDKRDVMEHDNPKNFVHFGMSTAMGLVSSEIYFAVLQAVFLLDDDHHPSPGGRDDTSRHNHHHYSSPSPSYDNFTTSSTSSSALSNNIIGSRLRDAAAALSVPGSVVSHDDHVPIKEILILVFCFTGFLVPMHCLSSYRIGLACARVQVQGKTFREAVLCPFFICVLFRTLFLASVLVVALQGELVVGLVLADATSFIFTVLVARAQAEMPAEYLRRTGYFTVLGFSAVATSEEQANNFDSQNVPHAAVVASTNIYDDE